MVVGIFASLAGIVNVNLSKTKVDSGVFQLHYRLASSFCFIACTLVVISDFIGEPIHCLGGNRAITTSCWVTSTYTIDSVSGQARFYVAYASNRSGIGNQYSAGKKKDLLQHSYYQWVPFILFLQGCLFYLPHFVWKSIEGKRVGNLLQDLGSLSVLDDSADQKKKTMVNYLIKTIGLNQKYCFGYFFCECMNLFSVAVQTIVLNSFFDGMFVQLGSKVFSVYSDYGQRRDALIRRFPRFTSCNFFKYGPSGTIEKSDFLCVLPQNLLNEKIFVIMWILLVFLFSITALSIVLRIIQMTVSRVRIKMITRKIKQQQQIPFNLTTLIEEMQLGDYFLLVAIGRNVDCLCFRDIINIMLREHERIRDKRPSFNKVPSTNDAFVQEEHSNEL